MCIQGFSENLTTALKESPHAEKESESSSQKVVKLHILLQTAQFLLQ